MADIQRQATLYSNLYTKYSKLKKGKDSTLEKLNHEQEVEFLKYHKVSGEMIEYLKNANEKLELQINDLRHENSSIRSSKDEDYLQFQKLLLVERQKIAKLSDEIDRLKNLEPEELYCQGDDGKSVGNLLIAPGSSMAEPNLAAEDESADRPSKRTKINKDTPNGFQPTCCKIMVDGSDVGTNASSLECMLQVFVECISGLKFSVVPQKEECCISASHLSTGYSFSLTWIKNSSGELQLRYDVLSLGTLERVAPEWMKETIKFGLSMCPVFFDRMRRVIKV